MQCVVYIYVKYPHEVIHQVTTHINYGLLLDNRHISDFYQAAVFARSGPPLD